LWGQVKKFKIFVFTPLEKATDSCRWYKSFLRDGGSMPPSLIVREHSSLTGFTRTLESYTP